MIAGHALRVSDPGQTLAFDHAMAPVLALCGVVQNGTVLMLESALPIGPSFSNGGSGNGLLPVCGPGVRQLFELV